MISNAKLRTDDRGIMELPFKLIIMIILISASVSVGMVSYRNMQRNAFEQQVMSELNRIRHLSLMMMQEGNLSSQEIELDLSGNLFAGIDHIRFGDSVGGRTEVVTYSMNWRRQRELMYLGDGIHLTSSRNSSFGLGGGLHKIRLTCMHISDDTTVIVISTEGQKIDHSSFYDG